VASRRAHLVTFSIDFSFCPFRIRFFNLSNDFWKICVPLRVVASSSAVEIEVTVSPINRGHTAEKLPNVLERTLDVGSDLGEVELSIVGYLVFLLKSAGWQADRFTPYFKS
jgi:uncharacterized membrane protein (UPF0182 family)